MTIRPPTIRPTLVDVKSNEEGNDSIGNVTIMTIEPREHTAWMQKVSNQGDLVALETKVETLKTDYEAHKTDTSTHGVGEIVGAMETQTLSGKTIVTPFSTTAVGVTLSTQNILQVTAAVTITVPTAVGAAGRTYIIDNAHSGATTVNPTGAETIEGETSQTLTGNCCMVIYSDGTNWRIA